MTTFYLAGQLELTYQRYLTINVTKDYIASYANVGGLVVYSKHSPHLDVVRTVPGRFFRSHVMGTRNQLLALARREEDIITCVVNLEHGTVAQVPNDARAILESRGEYSIGYQNNLYTLYNGEHYVEQFDDDGNECTLFDGGLFIHEVEPEGDKDTFKILTNAGAWIHDVHRPLELESLTGFATSTYNGHERNCLFGTIEHVGGSEVLLIQVTLGETDAFLTIVGRTYIEGGNRWIQSGPEGDFAARVNRGAQSWIQYYRPDPAGPDTLRGAWLRAGVATARAVWSTEPTHKHRK